MKEPLISQRSDSGYDPSDPESKLSRREGDNFIQVSNGSPKYEEGFKPKTNYITTSRYTWYNFIPKNLIEQFSNVANLYFLLIGALQIIPQITPTGGFPTMYQPLAFIVLVSALRAASEDWAKHKADSKRNSYRYLALRSSPGGARAKLIPTESGQLRMGDIVKVMKNEMIPTDMIFIGSALSKGHCFIDKANLNGETCLEVCASVIETRPYCNDDAIHQLHLELIAEAPNSRFSSFRGALRILNDRDNNKEIPLNGTHLLMRETVLRNCDFIYGLCVYTGNDTKIQMSNAEGVKAEGKISRIMRLVNVYLKYMLLAQVMMCLAAGVASAVFNAWHGNEHWYLRFGWVCTGNNCGPTPFVANVSTVAEAALTGFFVWFILLSQMVPISLVVSAEMVKFLACQFLQWDNDMYYDRIGKKAACNSSTVHEDLGLIDYILSDKTGTLTQNRMEFRHAVLPSAAYGSKETEISRAVQARHIELAQRKECHVQGIPYRQPRSMPWTKKVAELFGPPDHTPRWIDSTWLRHLWVQQPDPFHSDPSRSRAAIKPRTVRGQSVIAHKKVGDNKEDLSPTGCKQALGTRVDGLSEHEKKDLLEALWTPPTRIQGEPDPSNTAEVARAHLHRYMRHMALSNTVKPFDDEGVLKFQSESAEEQAMVMFAKAMGFTKLQTNPTVLEISDILHRDSQLTWTEKYRHVATLGFTPQRARVTVIYQSEDEKTIHVMSKGQDTTMMPLMKASAAEDDNLMLTLKDMCSNGLRTLLCCYSDLPASWWAERQARYQEIVNMDETSHSAGHNLNKCNTVLCEKCMAHDYFAQLEYDANLMYLGIVGLEDKLQDLVPDSISDYLRAGIKVWMITGDKLDTAKNIGMACNLIDADMEPCFDPNENLEACVQSFSDSRLIQVTGKWASLAGDDTELTKLFKTLDIDGDGSVDMAEIQIYLEALQFTKHPAEIGKLMAGQKARLTCEDFKTFMKSTKLSAFDAVAADIQEGLFRYDRIKDHEAFPIALLVTREAFQVMFPKAGTVSEISEDQLEILREKFFLLASLCKSVVFARAEPAMKKRMVTEIRDRVPSAMVLAVGDGANDTDMIMAAHVGVGIAGVEGTAATNSADYAIGTFHMLHPLIFVHGAWNYMRISDLVNFIFYKAVLLAVTPYFFGFFSGFSGQQLWVDTPYQLYNIMYTALPIIVLALLDKSLPRHALQNTPEVFRESKGLYFRRKTFYGWIGRAMLHSVIVFFIPYWTVGDDVIIMGTMNGAMEGQATGIWVFSSIVFNCVVLLPSTIIIFNMTNITIVHVFCIFCSIGSYYLTVYLFNVPGWFWSNPDLNGVTNAVLRTPTAWLSVILTVSIPLLLEFVWRSTRRNLRPSLNRVLRERLHEIKWKTEVESKTRTWSSGDGSSLDLPSLSEGREKLARTDPYSLINSTEYSAEWQHRKARTGRVTLEQRAKKLVDEMKKEESAEESQLEDADREAMLRANIVRSMLRFRNLTGSKFDSAAEAKNQDHDKFVRYNSPSPESKHA